MSRWCEKRIFRFVFKSYHFFNSKAGVYHGKGGWKKCKYHFTTITLIFKTLLLSLTHCCFSIVIKSSDVIHSLLLKLGVGGKIFGHKIDIWHPFQHQLGLPVFRRLSITPQHEIYLEKLSVKYAFCKNLCNFSTSEEYQNVLRLGNSGEGIEYFPQICHVLSSFSISFRYHHKLCVFQIIVFFLLWGHYGG